MAAVWVNSPGIRGDKSRSAFSLCAYRGRAVVTDARLL